MESSFTINLKGNFSQIKFKCLEESALLNELSNFFVLYFDECSSHVKKLETLIYPISNLIEKRRTIDAIAKFISDFQKSFNNHLLEVSNYLQNSLNYITSKFQEYSNSYSSIINTINNDIDELYQEYHEFEKKVFKSKIEYDIFRLNLFNKIHINETKPNSNEKDEPNLILKNQNS